MNAENPNEAQILLVEDSEADVELTLRAFKKHNLANKVFVVRDGAEALDFLFCEGKFSERDCSQHPRLVLLDLKLPKVSGLDVLRKLKSDPERRIIPVVVLTSSREDPDVAECYKLGVNSYVTKPVDFQEFVNAAAEIGMYWYLLNITKE